MKLMTQKQAAEKLGRSTKTLYRRRRDHQLSYIKDGQILYLEEDLETYIAQRRIAATEPPPAPRKPKYQRAGNKAERHREAILDEM